MKKSGGISSLLILGLLCSATASWAQSPSLPQFGHVFIVVEENHSYSSVVGSSSMPYLNSLISKYGLATNYVADTHPSIGNYFMLTTGHILTNNDSETPSSFPVSADNIAHELELAGKTWKDYREMTGTYYVRHDPLAYMTNINSANRVPFTQFATDLANGALPDFSFIVPNGCDDAHDCSLSTADAWLQSNLDPLVKSALFQQAGLLIVTFDEGSGSGSCTDSDIQAGTWCGGHVATVIISPLLVSAGFKSNISYHHENVLRLMMQGLGLTTFPGAAANAANMADFFAVTTPIVSLLPAAVTFANQPVGTTSAAQALTLKNETSASVSISNITITGTNSADFAQTNNCGSSLSAGTNCTIDVTFTPAVAGPAAATLSVSDNAAGSPQTAALTGTGVTATTTASVSPTSLTFPSQVVGTASTPKLTTLTNTGSTTLNITSLTISGEFIFAGQGTCGSTLAAGASCAINVSFKPTAAGTRTGTVRITDNATDSPQSVALSGVGEDFSIAAASGSSTSATVNAGQSATYKLDIVPEDGFNQPVSLSCSGAPLEATCSVFPTSTTLNGTNAASVTVTVTTTRRSGLPPRARPISPLRGMGRQWPGPLWSC